MARYSEQRLREFRDYAINEPSFTAAFAAWELGIHESAAHAMTRELLRLGIVHEIEPRKGPFAAVYQYAPPSENGHRSERHVSRHFAELDASRHARADLTPARGEPVPLTGRAHGPADKQSLNARRKRAGRRVRRPKTKGHS